jgi:hypothetical protein
MIEIGFKKENDKEFCIVEIGKILECLWSQKIPAVASYDYEELLLEIGGYNSLDVPWVADE